LSSVGLDYFGSFLVLSGVLRSIYVKLGLVIAGEQKTKKECSMEDAQILALDQQFSLQPPPPDELDEQVMLTILNGIDTPKEKRPLQCVTFKQPLPEYFRLKKICEFWHLQYSDVIRDVLRRLIPVLESPNEEIRECLERLRDADIEKKRLRNESRKKRQRMGLEVEV
jgi:hypothetical protein